MKVSLSRVRVTVASLVHGRQGTYGRVPRWAGSGSGRSPATSRRRGCSWTTGAGSDLERVVARTALRWSNLLDRQVWEGRRGAGRLGGWTGEWAWSDVLACSATNAGGRTASACSTIARSPARWSQRSRRARSSEMVPSATASVRAASKACGRPGTAQIEHGGDQIGVGRDDGLAQRSRSPSPAVVCPRGAGYGVPVGRRGGSPDCMLQSGPTWFFTAIWASPKGLIMVKVRPQGPLLP